MFSFLLLRLRASNGDCIDSMGGRCWWFPTGNLGKMIHLHAVASEKEYESNNRTCLSNPGHWNRIWKNTLNYLHNCSWLPSNNSWASKKWAKMSRRAHVMPLIPLTFTLFKATIERSAAALWCCRLVCVHSWYIISLHCTKQTKCLKKKKPTKIQCPSRFVL